MNILLAIAGLIASIGLNLLVQPSAPIEEVVGAPSLVYQKTILPLNANTYDLGSASNTWRAGYFSGALTVGSCTGCGASGGGSPADWNLLPSPNGSLIAPSTTVGIAIATSTAQPSGLFAVDTSGNVTVSGTIIGFSSIQASTSLSVASTTFARSGRFFVDSNGQIFTSSSLVFRGSGAPPAGDQGISKNGTVMTLNVPTANTFALTVNGGSAMTVGNTGNITGFGTFSAPGVWTRSSDEKLAFPTNDTNGTFLWDVSTGYLTTHAFNISLAQNSNQIIIQRNGSAAVNTGLLAMNDPTMIFQPTGLVASDRRLLLITQGTAGDTYQASSTLRALNTPIKLESASSAIWVSGFASTTIMVTSTKNAGNDGRGTAITMEDVDGACVVAYISRDTPPVWLLERGAQPCLAVATTSFR